MSERRRPPSWPGCAAALAAVLALAGCSATVPGGAVPAGALVTLAEDVDLGVADTGGGGRVELTALDSAGRPVVVSTTEFAGQAGLTRGTDLATSTPIASLGEFGQVDAMAVAPDDTVVLLAGSGEVGAPAVVRIAPDGTEQAFPLDLPDVVDVFSAGSALAGVGVAFTPDASKLLLTDVPVDSSQGFPVNEGQLQVIVVDTTTGAAQQVVEIPLVDPVGVVPGEAQLRVEAADIGADGSVAVAVAFADRDPAVLRLDAGLVPLGPAVGYPAPENEHTTFLALDDAGTLHLTQTADGVQLLRLSAGATETELVATLSEDSGIVRGLAVDASGTWAYLTGLTDIDLGETVVAVDLATGVNTPRTPFCDQGSSGAPSLNSDGTTLLVSGECSDVTTNQEHVYLFTA